MKEVTVELDTSMITRFNESKVIQICNEDEVKFAITKDKSEVYSRRINDKKHATYFLQNSDITELNKGEPYIFYYGKGINVLLHKTGTGDLNGS